MIGSSVGIAAAASFPSGFTSPTPAIVYGASAASSDSVAANSISTYLADNGVSVGVGSPTGESIEFKRASTVWNLGEGAEDVVTTSITDDSPSPGLPTILKEGVYVDDDNDEFDYTQKVDMGNISYTMWENSDYASDEPTTGIQVLNGAHILNYTLDFTDLPLWSDLQSTDIEIMGKNYFVLTYTNATSITLLDSATTTTLSWTDGGSETKTIEAGGKSYDISINFIGSSTVKLDVNGEITNTLSAAGTYKLKDGSYIGVKEINTQDYQGGIKTVEFSVGAGKLKLTSGSDVELNDASISNLPVTINYSGSSTGTKLNKIQIRWDADDDQFVTETNSISMPGFGALKLSTTGLEYPAEEVIQVKAGSDSYIQLVDFPLRDATVSIPIIYGDNKNFTGIGQKASGMLGTTNDSRLRIDGDAFDYFIVSWSDGKDGESYYMKVSNWINDSGTTKISVQYKDDSSSTGWTDAGSSVKEGDEVSVGNTVLTVGNIDKTNKIVNFTAGSNVKFDRLYSKEGATVFLPYNETFGGGSCPMGTAGQFNCLNLTTQVSGGGKMNLTISEEDKDGNKYGGHNITLELGWNTASTREVEVTDVLYLVGLSTKGASTEIQSTDVFRNFVYSELASEVLWTKPSSGQKSVKIIYHGDEVSANVFLSESSATSSAGNMVFKDNEKTSWETKNIIVVGGTCINTAAAMALGVAEGTCGADWVTATGVGAGKYLIESVEDQPMAGKIALVVAGFNADDTTAAANRVTKKPETVDTTAGKKYVWAIGESGDEVQVV